MKGLFSLDNPVMKLLGTLADLMILNLMWLVFCLPVVTAGASTVALQFACLRIIHGEELPIRDFWRSFKLNFKQATVIWLIVLLGLCCAVAGGYCLIVLNFNGKGFFALLYGVYTVLFLNFCSVLFPMVAQFENTTGNLLRNAFILSILKFGQALMSTVLGLVPVVWLLVSPESFLRFGFIWVLIGISGIAFLNNVRMDRIFKEQLAGAQE